MDRGTVGVARLPARVRRERLALMLTAYLDESASQVDGRRYLIVAGYLTDRESWSRFGRDWRPFLASYGLEFFHATDVSNRFRDEKNLKALKDKASAPWDEAKRDRCFADAGRIVKRHVDCGVSCAIDRDQFAGLVSRDQVPEPWSDPYFTAYFWALHAAVEVRQRYCFPSTWKMDVIFDEHKQHQVNALRAFRPGFEAIDETGRLDHEDARAALGLQAADVLAWRHQLRLRQAPHAMHRAFVAMEGRYILAEELSGPRLQLTHAGAMEAVQLHAMGV